MSARRPERTPGLAERMSRVAFVGATAAVCAWLVLACVEYFLQWPVPLSTHILSPDGHEALLRMTIVVAVLLGTLIAQMAIARGMRAQETLRLVQARIAQAYEHSPESIVCVSPELIVAYANPASHALGFASPSSDAAGSPCHQAIWGRYAPCDGCLVPEVLASHRLCERMVCDETSADTRWFAQTVYPVLDERGDVESLVEVTRDNTERMLSQQTIQRMAYHDALTGLPNRALFDDRLSASLARARRHGSVVAVIFADLDDFKTVNDTLGHTVGDAVLAAVAARLREVMREQDTVARLSGDEFTVVSEVASRDDAGTLASRVLEMLSEPITVQGHDLRVSASIGIATYPQDGEREAELLRNADIAMYRAKKLGQNVYQYYERHMADSAVERLGLESSLRHAVDHGEFELYYQPEVAVQGRNVVGVEALLRWNHPDQGVLLPRAFIEVVEQTGFMGQIGPWVLETACEQARIWLDEDLDFRHVAVNVSALELAHGDVVETVRQVLARTGLAPNRLELEIAESTAMHQMEHVVDILGQLTAMGVRTAIDDFGMGYSSMNSLKRLPLSTVKIAETFMRDAHSDSRTAAIAMMIIDLCEEIGLDVVAEGVESERQLEFLRVSGCFAIQGHIFSEALPADEATRFLKRLGHQTAPSEIVPSSPRTSRAMPNLAEEPAQ